MDPTIIVAIISALATIFCQYLISHKQHEDTTNDLTTQLATVNQRIDTCNERLRAVDTMAKDMNEIKTDIAVVKNDIGWIKNNANQRNNNENRLQKTLPRVGRFR